MWSEDFVVAVNKCYYPLFSWVTIIKFQVIFLPFQLHHPYPEVANILLSTLVLQSVVPPLPLTVLDLCHIYICVTFHRIPQFSLKHSKLIYSHYLQELMLSLYLLSCIFNNFFSFDDFETYLYLLRQNKTQK